MNAVRNTDLLSDEVHGPNRSHALRVNTYVALRVMHRKFGKNLTSVLLVALIYFVFQTEFTGSIWAQDVSEDAALEDVLSGFDDEDSGELDEDILSGFDEEVKETETGEDPVPEDAGGSWSSVSGAVGMNLSYSYAKEAPTSASEADWSGLTKLRPYLSLTWDAKLGDKWKTRISGKVFHDFAYQLKDRDTFSEEVLSEMEQETEMREVYFEGRLTDNLDLKIGSQIVAWGTANSLRVVDVLNPTDNREFGMTDLEDIRLPISMTRLDYYFGDIKLQAVAVHQIKFNKTAPPGSDFNPSTQKIDEIVPRSNKENTEYGLALIGTFSGWDASLHWAQIYDDAAHFEVASVMIVPFVGAVSVLEQKHSRLTMTGAAVSVPSGSRLWKVEAAQLQGLEFLYVSDKTFSRYDVLLGVEYSGWDDTQLIIESGVQHLNDFDARLEADPDSQLEDRFASTLNFQQDYLHQTLHLNLVGMMIGRRGEDGGLNRASLEYDIMDAFSVTAGVMFYQTGDSAYFQSISENDRFFFETRYSF